MKNQERYPNRKLKVAILGYGKMGMHHIRAIQLMGSAHIIAVADPYKDLKKLKAFPLEEKKMFSEPEDLFKSVRPDVVHITTPPSTHVNLSKLALRHGANIYVEKPFAAKRTDAEEIVSLAHEMGLRTCAGHQVLFESPARKIQELLREIGRIVHIESYFSFKTVRRSISPVDQLLDILPHPVYLLLHFLQVCLSPEQEDRIEIKSIEVRPSGEVRGILQAGDALGLLIVTLEGRPIESYLRIVGTNGSLYADFVRGTVTKLAGPGTSAISLVVNPYSQTKQVFWGTTKSFIKLSLRKHRRYPGLSELIEAFYESILNQTPSPLSTASIIETVTVCEKIARRLKKADREFETSARSQYERLESEIAPIDPDKGYILVTGGTGFLGSVVTKKMRIQNWPVRVIARHAPSYSARIPGVEYVTADLGNGIHKDLLKGVVAVIHCAAETTGGKEEHERNTVLATQSILDAAAKTGVKKVIHISSTAVLKTSRETGGPLDEKSPIDLDNLGRGPYVWGKAKSEHLVRELGSKLGIEIRIIRLGPLVDYNNFKAPGRLGREIGPRFIAIGGRKSRLSLCEVPTAAEVIGAYVRDFDAAPLVLNLVEPNPPTRAELVDRLLEERPDLKVFWLPMIVIRAMSPFLILLQRIIFPKKEPINIQKVFASEKYETSLAAQIIQKVGKT